MAFAGRFLAENFVGLQHQCVLVIDMARPVRVEYPGAIYHIMSKWETAGSEQKGGTAVLIGLVFFLVFSAGCIGGFANSLITGELKLPAHDTEARVFKPGWVGNVVVGGIASIVFWGLYGPLADANIIGQDEATDVTLTVSELLGSLLTGIGGGRLLTMEVDRRVSESGTKALEEAKNSLAETILDLSEES